MSVELYLLSHAVLTQRLIHSAVCGMIWASFKQVSHGRNRSVRENLLSLYCTGVSLYCECVRLWVGSSSVSSILDFTTRSVVILPHTRPGPVRSANFSQISLRKWCHCVASTTLRVFSVYRFRYCQQAPASIPTTRMWFVDWCHVTRFLSRFCANRAIQLKVQATYP